jgi:hypothetical protein
MKTNSSFFAIKVTIIAMLLVRAFLLTAQHSIIGTTDINAFIEQVPGLPRNTDEAMKRAGNHPTQPDRSALDRHYLPFEDKVNHRIDEYKAFAQQKMTHATEADYRQAAAAIADSNPIVAGMGGYEKVSKMSEAEAKAAAQQSAAAYMADPFAANGVQSAGMTALYQKIISDPVYAKQFEKMSEAEKEAELRKYMANDQPATTTPQQVKAQQAQTANQQLQADRIRFAQEVQLKIAALQQQMTDVSADFDQWLTDIAQQGNSHEAISLDAGKRYEAIPMVELGEYGRDHDPAQVAVLRKAEAKQHREQAQQELEQQMAAFEEVANRYQAIVSEYLNFVKKNGKKIHGGTSVKDMMDGTNTEQPLVTFEMRLLGIPLELSQKSRELTQEAAQWEANYVQTMQTYQTR